MHPLYAHPASSTSVGGAQLAPLRYLVRRSVTMWACPRPCSNATHSSRSCRRRGRRRVPGRGSTALISGEAGIGKTSLVRAFVERLGGEARLSSWRRATTSSRRARWDRCTTRRPGAPARSRPRWPTRARSIGVFAALLEELAEERPTVLVVEDVHWADDATLDVLGYAARRVEAVGAVLVLTTRDDELDPRHPLHRLLGALAGCPVHRIELPPLSRDAVQHAGGRHRPRPGRPARADARQPVLRHRDARRRRAARCRPASRTRCSPACARLDPDCREALERLRWCRRTCRPSWPRSCSARRCALLAAAELAGLIEDAPRRARVPPRAGPARDRGAASPSSAVRAAQPGRRRGAARAGSARARPPDAPRGRGRRRRDRARGRPERRARGRPRRLAPPGAGPLRGRRALRWRASRPREQAAVLDDYGWELYNAARFREAVRAGQRGGASSTRGLGDPVALGLCLVRVSRHWFMAGETDAAEDCAERAVRILEAARRRRGRWPRRRSIRARSSPWPRIPSEAGAALRRARPPLARASQRMDLAVLCLNYLGIARVESGDPERPRGGARQHRLAVAGRHHEEAARGYTNLAELLLRVGRLDELERCVADGLAFTHERGFWSHAYNLEVHRCLLLLRRGDWDGAEAGLRGLVGRRRRPRDALRLQRPVARAPARPARRPGRRGDARGGVGAGPAPPAAAGAGLRGDRARRVGVAGRQSPTSPSGSRSGAACAHRASGRGARSAASCCATSLARGCRRSPSTAARRGGRPGCSGDWRAAAAAWQAAGDPYETALELAESGDAEATAEALRMLEDLRAEPAARPRARAPAGDGRARPARPAGGDARQPRRPHAAPARGPRPAARGHDQRRDRRPPRPLGAHGRPPRGGRPDKLGVRSRREAAAAAQELGVGS